MAEKVKLAHLGGGYWGKNIVRNLHDLKVLTVICDTNLHSLQSYRQEYPDVQCVENFNDVLLDESIAAVTIATPAATHFAMVRQALEAGKDVFVEKPLSLSPEQGVELAELARTQDKILMVGHILRYHPAIEKIKKLIDDGALGRVRFCSSNRLNLGKVRTEENILWSFAPHDISVLIHLMGGPPDEVTSSGEIILQPGIHDVTSTVMRWRNGTMATINVSWLHPYKEHKLVIVGDKAMLVFDDTKERDKLALYDRGIDFIRGQPVKREDGIQVIDYQHKEPLRAEMEHFLSCMATRQRPRTDAAEAIEVLRVLHSAQKSLEHGGQKSPASETRDYFVHPTAVVDSGAQIGAGTKIWHFSHVMPKSRIGRKCTLGQNVHVAPNVVVGDHVKIQNNVSLYEGVVLEDNCFCGPSMVFTNVKTPRSAFPRNTAEDYLTTHVKQGASLGANCTIICGVTIGENAFVAAGAVVTKDVRPFALMAGVPARQIGWMCVCGIRLPQAKDGDQGLTCSDCGQTYLFRENGQLEPA
ncbi:MAG: Gfo/Idh/MocA family oxidoreductase [bacterium]